MAGPLRGIVSRPYRPGPLGRYLLTDRRQARKLPGKSIAPPSLAGPEVQNPGQRIPLACQRESVFYLIATRQDHPKLVQIARLATLEIER